MMRLIGRAVAIGLVAALASASALAQPKKKAPPKPPAKAQQPPEPLPMGWGYPPHFGGYPGMPVYSFERWQGKAPPAPEPITYPFTGFVAGYPYPGYTMLSPYPRTVSSYSSGPSLSFPTGRVWGWHR
jgi:hypothetical protein